MFLLKLIHRTHYHNISIWCQLPPDLRFCGSICVYLIIQLSPDCRNLMAITSKLFFWSSRSWYSRHINIKCHLRLFAGQSANIQLVICHSIGQYIITVQPVLFITYWLQEFQTPVLCIFLMIHNECGQLVEYKWKAQRYCLTVFINSNNRKLLSTILWCAH